MDLTVFAIMISRAFRACATHLAATLNPELLDPTPQGGAQSDGVLPVQVRRSACRQNPSWFMSRRHTMLVRDTHASLKLYIRLRKQMR